jgi:hypothetical protein
MRNVYPFFLRDDKSYFRDSDYPKPSDPSNLRGGVGDAGTAGFCGADGAAGVRLAAAPLVLAGLTVNW